MIIFSNVNIFSSRFRHHTLTVVNKYCLSLFSKIQQVQLPTIEQIALNKIIDSWAYLHDNDQLVSEDFKNTFAYRGVYKSVKDFKNPIERRYLCESIRPLDSSHYIRQDSFKKDLCLEVKRLKADFVALTFLILEIVNKNVSINHNHTNKKQYIDEAKSARTGRFNTLPERSNVDKFKTRF
ncbi:unnamed protein product, partial [Rotaria sp. Silwood1]